MQSYFEHFFTLFRTQSVQSNAFLVFHNSFKYGCVAVVRAPGLQVEVRDAWGHSARALREARPWPLREDAAAPGPRSWAWGLRAVWGLAEKSQRRVRTGRIAC